MSGSTTGAPAEDVAPDSRSSGSFVQSSRRHQRRRTAAGLTRGICIAIVVIVAVAPFLYVVQVSFRNSYTLFQYPPQWIPKHLSFINYRYVLQAYPFIRWLLNSLGVAAVVTALKLAIDSLAAYSLARLDFRGKRLLWVVMLGALLVPQALLLVPLFFIVRDLGIFNTYWALILPPLANPLGVFMLRAFIRALPIDLEQAARVDGCNDLQIYWRVVLPLIKPALTVVATYTFVFQYSSFVWPLVGTNSPSLQVLSVGLSTLNPVGGATQLPYGYIAAASVMATLVMAAVFVLFQRQFVGGSLVGALKE